MRRHQQNGAGAQKQTKHKEAIDSTTAIIILLALAALIAVAAAFISTALEDLENWRMRAERFEELYFDEVYRNAQNTLKQ